MLKRTMLKTLLAAAAVSVTSSIAEANEVKKGYADVNGVSYYYEISGQGDPLLLLHGGLGSMEMFGQVRSALAPHRQVIAVDLHGHGRTALGVRHIDLIEQGNDMAGMLRAIGVTRADVMGYSMGAQVAFQFSTQHPEMVRRLVMVSGGFAQDGFHPEMLPMQASVGAAMADAMKGTPMYETYMALAPVKEDFPRLLDEMGAWMRKPYDWSADVAKLAMPVMLVYGDSDMYRPEHIVKFYQLLGGGLKDAGWQREHMSRNRLAILPNLTHYEVFMARQLPETVLPFLDGNDKPPVWGESAN
jgi:pimeloyl-ACP methyl ester carboxylesterase